MSRDMAAPDVTTPVGNTANNGGINSVIKIAIMAVGGQGGGVLTQWIETLSRAKGYAVQATSVAGVAQRTGATIYYIEMFEAREAASSKPGQTPVFSLAPAEGDVDILIAAELMEAGRAVMRGFVTPYNTTLIASTHRAHAVSEKMVPGDGISDPAPVIAAAQEHSLRAIMLDMEAIAVAEGSVISASLFGALSAAGVLPFQVSAFEEALRSSNRGVEKSLRAFHSARKAVMSDADQAAVVSGSPTSGNNFADSAGTVSSSENQSSLEKDASVEGPDRELERWHKLRQRALALPSQTQEIALAGLTKVVDFQDIDYGHEYLDRLDSMLAHDSAALNFELTCESAKYIANAMAYDDVIRVADLKTRQTRFARIRKEMRSTDSHRLKLTEYMHPRGEELLGLLPLSLARWIKQKPQLVGFIDKILGAGRRWRSDRITGFFPLYIVAGLRKWRRRSLRHAEEVEHLESWLATAVNYLPGNYDLAVEIIKCQRLIKGYSDTHERGQSKFHRVIAALPSLDHKEDAASILSQLRQAALSDEKGGELDTLVQSL